jgi:hypothetical protein
MPKGLSGILGGVKLCPEAQANEGTCGPESLIGETIVGVGVGSDPFSVTGGRVFLTEGYKGSPFSIVLVVVPAVAGPFVLPTQRVRAKIDVDPRTAQLTITTDPSGPHAIPHLIDGVPVQIRKVNVLVNRPEFTFNPTSCEAKAITATVIGSSESGQGASAHLSVPFQVADCANLAFKPKFAVSTEGKASKANGASLSVKLSFPHSGPQSGNQSGEANVAKVRVELPKSLPSRLTTLQKACTSAVFDQNPAGCPPESIVGHAKAITPVLPVPLEGPAYFVSHGGAAFPELILVLQGYGITIDLAGETFIDEKTDVTSSTFAHVPDAPVTSFELTLPQGKYSALAGIGNLCNQKLVMPTQFVAQNGAQVNQQTRIEVQGCSNSLSVVSEKVKGNKVTLKIAVPEGGQLSAGGKGLKGASKSSSGRETVTITVPKKKAGKLVTKIKLSFTPKKGKKLSKTVTAKFKH